MGYGGTCSEEDRMRASARCGEKARDLKFFMPGGLIFAIARPGAGGLTAGGKSLLLCVTADAGRLPMALAKKLFAA
jgi:hypothetical protein